MRVISLSWKQRFAARVSRMASVVTFVWAGSASIARAQDTLGGHIGFVLPLVTRSGDQTTNITDNFSIGFPMGITVKGQGSMAFDLELVPGVRNSPDPRVNLTVHPGFVWDAGFVAVGARLAFEIRDSTFGFTPLVNKSWPISESFFKAFFAEAVLPVRFNRPTNGAGANAVTFGLHFGVGF